MYNGGLVAVLVIGCVGCVIDGGGDDGGGDDGGSCSAAADSCGGETICVGGACVAAFPRVYAVRSISVALPTTDPDGAAWDIGGGAPDILVEVRVGSTVAATTTAVQDQFSTTFAGPYDVQLIAGSTLRIDVYDEDVTINDPAVACAANPITSALLRGRELSCAATVTTGSVMFRVEPR